MIRLKIKITIILLITILLIYTLSAQHSNLKNNKKYLHSYSLYLKAKAYKKNQQLDQALFLFKKAIKQYAEYPEPYYGLISIYMERTDYNQISQYINKCDKYIVLFQNKTDLAEYHRLKGRYYGMKKEYNKALDNYLKLYSLRSQEFKLLYQIGYFYYKLGKDQAENNLNKYVDLAEKNKTYKALKYDSDFKNALQILVNITMNKNKYVEAYELLNKLYQYYPDREIREKMSILSNNLKNYNE